MNFLFECIKGYLELETKSYKDVESISPLCSSIESYVILCVFFSLCHPVDRRTIWSSLRSDWRAHRGGPISADLRHARFCTAPNAQRLRTFRV